MTRPDDETKRSFARVEVTLPVRVRKIDPVEAQKLAERLELEPSYTERLSADLANRRGGESSWERLAILTMLEKIEKLEKGLETIAGSLGVSLGEPGTWIEGETVSLSGSGMGLRLAQRLEEDTLVEVEITLLGETTGTVRLLGRIIILVNPDGQELPVGRFHLGISFETFNKEDREAIVHYTFRLQRAQIREMREDEL